MAGHLPSTWEVLVAILSTTKTRTNADREVVYVCVCVYYVVIPNNIQYSNNYVIKANM